MYHGPYKKNPSLFWVLHVGGWLLYLAAGAFISYPGPWTDFPAVVRFMIPSMGGFLICIPLRYIYKKTRFHEQPLKWALLAALAASVVGANVWMGMNFVIGIFIPDPNAASTTFIQVLAYYQINAAIPLFAWTSLYFGIKMGREWKQQEGRAEQANALAQDAQLQMLRCQINPHFLFNSLNSIRALIDEDEAKASDMITELAEFLRYSLISTSYSDVPLQEEMEAIRHYFAIQKKRYEDKLEVIYDIDPQACEYPVLSFLINPLVENAVKYGMRTSPMPLVIRLAAKIEDGNLAVEVSNTGRWVEPGPREDRVCAGTGTGLDNIRRRLENAFPGRHTLDTFQQEGQVHVRLTISGFRRTADEKTF